MTRIALTALAGLALLAAGAALLRPAGAGAVGSAATDAASGITVQGSATVSAAPDKAQLSFGVSSQAPTARAALAANATEMRRVIAALRGAGVAELHTDSVWLSPQYGDANAVTGYAAQNSVSATVAAARAGAVIDAAVGAGANQVSGPSLSSSEQASLYRQALKAAVEDARLRAQALAEAAGSTLGRVTQVVESGAAPQPVPMAEKAAAADSTPIEPGQQQIEADVTVTFALG